MKLRILLVVGVLLPVIGTAASPNVTIRPTDRAWEQFGLADRIPVLGDVADPDCPSVTLVRLHRDVRLPLHSAPADRTYLLLSGTIHLGIGKRWDEARMRTLPAGSFWVVPANTTTFEWAEDEVVVQVSTIWSPRGCPRVEQPVVYTPDRLAWKAFGSLDIAVLEGDPMEPRCPHAERLRFPPSSDAVPPVGHSSGSVLWTVLSGGLRREGAVPGVEGSTSTVPPGSIITAPADLDGIRVAGIATIAQREFTGTGTRLCEWRERHH